MNEWPKELRRYLRRRQAHGPWTIEPKQKQSYEACIVIPALAESLTLPHTLQSLSTNGTDFLSRTLILVVLNNRIDTDHRQIHDNGNTLQILQNFPDCGLNLAWVDAYSHGRELPAGQGVGLARKIGFDLALSLLNWSAEPFLISLDADTLIHCDYLQALFNHFADTKSGGAVIPFRHQSGATAEQEQAIRHYELYLRSYSYGLKLAGSLYAYNSIGSAIACRARAYIQAGGMNRRLAGEDFYFLQQLAKTSGVSTVKGALVFPSPRESERVPFGTGRTVTALCDNDSDPFLFCDKNAFEVLHNWLALATNCRQAGSSELLRQALHINPLLVTFLDKLNFSENWQLLQTNHRDDKQFIRAFHGWFDGLRSRQLLTCLAGSDEMEELEIVNDLLVWGGHDPLLDTNEQLFLLEKLQGVSTELSGFCP